MMSLASLGWISGTYSVTLKCYSLYPKVLRFASTLDIKLAMEQVTPYYIQRIKDEFSQKQRRSSRYSLRAYARDLGVHPATLSLVLKGKRKLPPRDSTLIAQKMSMGPKEKTLFFESIYKSQIKLDDIQISIVDERVMLDESYFNVIAEWEHYAVLTLFDLFNFSGSIPEICEQLSITETRAEVVLHNLVTCGLLRKNNDKLEKSQSSVRTTEDITSLAIQKSHIETLEIGIEKIKTIDVSLRDFSSMNIAVDLEKLPEAKTILREFRQKMAALMKDGQKTEVFQLAIQFYPLTENYKREGEL